MICNVKLGSPGSCDGATFVSLAAVFPFEMFSITYPLN